MEINLQIGKKGDWDHVVYAGPINEDTEVHLARVAAQLGKNVIFNFRQVEYVNSCGVRSWINFLRDIQEGREVIFEECTPEIVSQINMIPNFRGKAHIKSVTHHMPATIVKIRLGNCLKKDKTVPSTVLILHSRFPAAPFEITV